MPVESLLFTFLQSVPASVRPILSSAEALVCGQWSITELNEHLLEISPVMKDLVHLK